MTGLVILRENQHFVNVVFQVPDGRVNVFDDVFVAGQLPHDLDFTLADFQVMFVVDIHPLQGETLTVDTLMSRGAPRIALKVRREADRSVRGNQSWRK